MVVFFSPMLSCTHGLAYFLGLIKLSCQDNFSMCNLDNHEKYTKRYNNIILLEVIEKITVGFLNLHVNIIFSDGYVVSLCVFF